VDGACGTNGTGEKSVLSFCGKSLEKETTQKAEAWVGGLDQNGS
jgi:hypothetical protein